MQLFFQYEDEKRGVTSFEMGQESESTYADGKIIEKGVRRFRLSSM